MHGTQGTIWISFGAEDGHTLYPAEVCGTSHKAAPGTTLCRFDSALNVESVFAEGRDAVVYFHGNGGFLQQPARICNSTEGPEAGTLQVTSIGIAAIAEDRLTDRVGVAIPECTAVLAGDDVCTIADASTRGLSVVSNETYEPGQIVQVAFEVGSGIYTGLSRIQSLSPVQDQTRYGMLVLSGNEGGTLRSGLEDLTAAVERSMRHPMHKAG